MEDYISEKELKKMFKDDDIKWKSDEEFFEIAKKQGFEYDDDEEMFVGMKTFNEAPYGEDAKVDYDDEDMIEIFPLDKNGDNIKLF